MAKTTTARKITSRNANRSVLSDKANTGLVLAYVEACKVQAAHEAAGTWETPAGIAAEKSMGHLAMALEALGFDLNDIK